VYPSFDDNNDAFDFNPQFDSDGTYIGLLASIEATYGQQVGLGSGGV
jgi:hypothetical protein